MKNKKIKATHGALLVDEQNSVLEDVFTKSNHRISLAEKYKDKLGNMSLEELQELALEIGIMPIDNRDLLIKSLKRELKK